MEYERMKYVSLKTPPSTAKYLTAKPVNKGAVSSTTNVVKIGNVLYKVDFQVFPHIRDMTFLTCAELKATIASVRKSLSIEIPLQVRFGATPTGLRQTQQAYSSTGFTHYTSENNIFCYPYKFTAYDGTSDQVLSALSSAGLDSEKFDLSGVCYLSVLKNDKTAYTSYVQDLYESASIFGKHLVARTSFLAYENSKTITFDKLYAVLNPSSLTGQYTSFIGVLIQTALDNPTNRVIFVAVRLYYVILSIPVPNISLTVFYSSPNEQEFLQKIKNTLIDPDNPIAIGTRVVNLLTF